MVADWAGHVFQGVGPGVAQIIDRDGNERTFPLDLFQQTVRVVCEKCNSGWMSKLERSVSPKLGPMIRDERATRLTPRTQAAIATWTVKTAFMLEHLYPSPHTVPESENHRFYTIQQPPNGYRVWLARRRFLTDSAGRELLVAAESEAIGRISGAENEAVARQTVDWFSQPGNAMFRITFTIGHVVFQVFGHNAPIGFRIAMPPIRVVDRIWPIQDRVTWPPPIPVENIGGYIALHKAFQTPPQ